MEKGIQHSSKRSYEVYIDDLGWPQGGMSSGSCIMLVEY